MPWNSVNSGAFFDTRVDGPSTWVSKNALEFTGRQLGPWTRAVNLGSGNRALLNVTWIKTVDHHSQFKKKTHSQNERERINNLKMPFIVIHFHILRVLYDVK